MRPGQIPGAGYSVKRKGMAGPSRIRGLDSTIREGVFGRGEKGLLGP